MANFTIMRSGLNTEIVGDPHIGQSSEDVTVAVKDDGTYSGYAKRLYYSYCYHNELHRALSAVNSNNEFIIPVQAFFEPGMVKLSVELSNGTNCPACNACFLIVTDGAKDVDTSVLPSEKTWQSYIQSYIKSDVDALGKRIDNLILSSGSESSAEVADARTGYDGTAYKTLGTAIRTQAVNSIAQYRSAIKATQDVVNYLHSNSLNIKFLRDYWIDENGVLKAYDGCETAIFPVIKWNTYVYNVNGYDGLRQVVAFYDTKPYEGIQSYDEKTLSIRRNNIFQAPITGYCAIYYSVKKVDIDTVGFKVSVVSDEFYKKLNKGDVLNNTLTSKIEVEHLRNTNLSYDTFGFFSDPTFNGESVVFPAVKNNYYVYSCNNNNYTRNRVAFFDHKPINNDISNFHYNIDSGVPFVSPIDGYCVVHYYNSNSTVSDIEDEISIYSCPRKNTVPQYYNQYLVDKEKAIMSKEEFSGIDGDEFVFITDYHYESNTNNSPVLIDHILRNTGANKIIFGGDAYNSANTNNNAFSNAEAIENAKRKLNVFRSFWSDLCKDNFYYVVGNHEYNNPGSNEPNKQLSNNAVYSLCMRENEDKIVTNGFNYYFDNKNKKIRYICVPCEYNTSVTSEATKAIEMINNVPDGWSVVVISHIGTNETKETLNTLKNSIKPIADALKNNSTRINVIGIFCGHTHADALFKYNDINIIATTCDAYKSEFGDLSRNKNDISEQAFDVVNIDTKNRHVYLTRIGAGNDREFSY